MLSSSGGEAGSKYKQVRFCSADACPLLVANSETPRHVQEWSGFYLGKVQNRAVQLDSLKGAKP